MVIRGERRFGFLSWYLDTYISIKHCYLEVGFGFESQYLDACIPIKHCIGVRVMRDWLMDELLYSGQNSRPTNRHWNLISFIKGALPSSLFARKIKRGTSSGPEDRVLSLSQHHPGPWNWFTTHTSLRALCTFAEKIKKWCKTGVRKTPRRQLIIVRGIGVWMAKQSTADHMICGIQQDGAGGSNTNSPKLRHSKNCHAGRTTIAHWD